MFCDKKIVAGVSLCEHCSRPTQWASHDERVDWEVAQWRQTRAEARVPAAVAATPPARRKKPAPEAPHRPTPPARRTRERAPVVSGAQNTEMYVPQPSRPSSYAGRRSSRVAPEPGRAPMRAAPAAQETPQQVRTNGLAPAREDTGSVVRLESAEKKVSAPSASPSVVDGRDQAAITTEPAKAPTKASPKAPTQKAMLEQALDMLGTLEGRLASVESHLRSMAQDRPAPRRIFRRRAQ
jgi:hypothetical protein